MDRIPGGGGPPGAGVDGAFERFLTAAIATIITIMFSWRLLAEEEEANARGGQVPPYKRPAVQYRPLNTGYGRFDPLKPRPQSPTGLSLGLSEIDISDSEESGVGSSKSPDSDEVVENVINERFESQTDAELDSAPPPMVQTYDDVDDSEETLTTWDQYTWEEELGQEDTHVIKTRRSLRDFVKSPGLNLQSPPRPDNTDDNSDLASITAVANANSGDSVDSVRSPVVPFSQRFANFEYKDTGGDSGYVDLYPDSDTSDSSDDENVYEIQVSDSDSDSGDERAGSFFGVTALDTIMEEIESDDVESESSDTGDGYARKGHRENDVDNVFEELERDTSINVSRECEPRLDVCGEGQVEYDSHLPCSSDVDITVDKPFTPEPSVAHIDGEISQVETLECNLSPEITYNVESVPSVEPPASGDLQKCELSVTNTSALNENTTNTETSDKCRPTGGDLNYIQPKNSPDLSSPTEVVETLVARESKPISSTPNKMTLPLARQTEIDYNISEISDDSLPSSPVRTFALDNLGDNYSDTESCSSESVITVLSVRSNDSDSYGERYDVTGNGPSGKAGHRQNVAPGKTDQSPNINDLVTEGSGMYENNSLVSGFLNDSLNNLLDANNGDTDTESEGDYDNENATSVDPDQTEATLNKSNDYNSDENIEAGLNERKRECEESISPEESIIPEMNKLQSNESVSRPQEISDHDIPDNESKPIDQLDGGFLAGETQSTLQNDFNCSDNSSDSSDPPLREYDPDDDDLAAFQFSQECDNDSFYLLVGNEGSLRNFDTFNNLNSLGLSPEYGDAVPSHATAEEARGFKFSYTEEINTDYKKRSYYTDRNISSDSDGCRSDEPLSPITSEDEEMVAQENDKNEKFLNVAPSELGATSAYDDAELSTPVIDTSDVNNAENSSKRSIDFHKYIIHPETSYQGETVPDQDKIRSQNAHKDGYVIDKDSGTIGCAIDSAGVIAGSQSVNGINNITGDREETETFSSLTEKIRGLSHVSDSDSSENERAVKTRDTHCAESDFNFEESDINRDSNSTPITRGSNVSKQIETNIDDIFVESKPEEQETLLFDIKCSSGRVGDAGEEFIIKSVPVTSTENSPEKREKVETNIDDIFEENVKLEAKVAAKSLHSTPSRSKVETNIDDIFDDNSGTHTNNANASGKIETNIDDICNENKPKSVQSSRTSAKIETNLDDIFDNAEQSAPTRVKIETSVDDIIADDEKKLSYETFVDDLLQPVDSSHTQSVPKSVTSESAIDSANLESSREICELDDAVAASVETAIEAEIQTATRSQPLRSADRVTHHQYSSGKSPSDVYTSDNSTLKDKSSDIVDKISDKPHVEKSLDISIERKNNDRKSNTAIKHTGERDPLLKLCVESHLNTEIPYSQYKTEPKQQNYTNDTNNNSELGLPPGQNKEDNCTQDHGQLAHNAPSGKSPHNTRDIDYLRPEVSIADIELNITDDDARSQKSDNANSDYSDNLSSLGSSSFVSDDESFHSVDENLLYQYTKQRDRGLSESAISRVVRSPLTKPSELFSPKSNLGHGVRRKIHKHHLKKYTSVLQRPVTPERSESPVLIPPEKPLSSTRLKVLQSRQRFLSAENLSGSNFEDKFLQHRTSLVTSTPRKYLKRHERHLTELQSTESLPTDMSHHSFLNTSYDSYNSMDKMHSLPSPRYIEELYASSRHSSTNSSFDKPDHHRLHANCIFSPEKRAEIQHTNQSLENMFEQLLRDGTGSSLAVETDLDAEPVPQNTSFVSEADFSDYVSFQCPLERAASMSAITETSDGRRLPRKPRRFAKKSVQKSKSLQTLETNLDDVFDDEKELAGGTLKKVPSVHELRVSKSLSKLNVPSWFSRSTFSRSDSTQSLFTYAGRLGSTSTLGSAYPPSITSSPCPTPTSGAVIIQKRVTPSPTAPSGKLLRAPALPVTPEKAPIHNTSTALPSDKFRKTDKKDLKPIAIIPFAKLRAMFEQGVPQKQETQKTVSATSPTKDKPRVTFEKYSPTKEHPVPITRRETTIDDVVEPVQNRTVSTSPTPALPERKPILTDPAKRSESAPQANAQPRRTQVHFSDEQNVSKPQEPKSNVVQQNGTSSKPKSTIKKSGFRAALPLPQFKFRRPGAFATKAPPPEPAPPKAPSQPEVPKTKKGKENGVNGYYPDHRDLIACDKCTQLSCPPWLHALELNAKTDGEVLFEFLQKRRYSSILENGFAEQLDELQDRDVHFNFPVVTLGKHSNGLTPLDGAPDLRVVLTDACSHRAQNDFLNNKLRSDSSVDDILDGLLLLDGYRTGRMRMDENGRIVPKLPGEGAYTPDTPPGLALNHNTPMCKNNYDVFCVDDDSDVNVDYVLVKCEFPPCHRETNLKEAKKCYKTCHSCFTYYCSRACRKNDWDAHKKLCVYSRINSACKHVIKCINRVPQLQYQCSRVARRGYLAQGRGCVVFAFPDIGAADDFLYYGMESLWVPPVYIALKDLPNATMLGSKLEILSETCKQYNPELKYVIHVAVVIPPQLPVRPVPRRMDGIIQKCAKLRLSPAHMHPKQDNAEVPTTLILTAVPGNTHSDEQDGRKTRELCFINIQRKLRTRGVSLRHKFPEVYNRLIDFVSDAKHFSPLIIYPTDGRTGRKFMCVIMPEAAAEIEWISDPDVFHELDVFDDDEEEISTPNLSLCLQEEVML